jgi:hydroxymethylglutaryl-CoA lyase
VSERVRITDVSPRDGLQNEPGVIPTPDKVRLVELLAATGVDEIEVTSFVSARWVPQLGDAPDVLRGLAPGRPRVGAGTDVTPALGWGLPTAPLLSALVPNEMGLRALLVANRAAGRRLVGKASVFTAASESFARKNINATIAESIERFRPVVQGAHDAGLLVRGYVSCVVACPFEGAIDPARAAGVCVMLRELGVDEIDLGDTIGAGTPETIARLLDRVRAALGHAWWTPERLTLHLHDTFGRAASCVRAALDRGVRSFDASVAGLGGCPYASTPGTRAPGNIDTMVLVRTIRDAGFETGVDLAALDAAAAFAREIVGRSRGLPS